MIVGALRAAQFLSCRGMPEPQRSDEGSEVFAIGRNQYGVDGGIKAGSVFETERAETGDGANGKRIAEGVLQRFAVPWAFNSGTVKKPTNSTNRKRAAIGLPPGRQRQRSLRQG